MGLGEGRWGTPPGLWLVAPLALNWKRLEGADGLAAGLTCSVFALLDRGASEGSSDRLFTPAAALLGTSPGVGRADGVGRWPLAVSLDEVGGLPSDAISWLNAWQMRQSVENGHRGSESSYAHLGTRMRWLTSPDRGVANCHVQKVSVSMQWRGVSWQVFRLLSRNMLVLSV